MVSISVIIPAYNEEKYIEKTLNSIQSQSFSDYEVIVVLNGCTDNTEQMVKKFKRINLKYFSLPQAQVSKARNAGAFKAQGNILVFLDADTQLAEDSLLTIQQQFHPPFSVATTKVLPDQSLLKYRIAMAFKNIYNSSKIYNGCSGILICRKEEFHKVGGYNSDLQVKEHHTLTKLLQKIGKYKCINTYVTTSMRRHVQWGLLKGTWFWLMQWIKEKKHTVKDSEYEKIR